MAEFESWKQYEEFSHFVRRKSRYIIDLKNQQFLDTVLETSESRKNFILKGDKLWRAQLGSKDDKNPFSIRRMSPQGDRAYEGRVNPKGIPCPYCSSKMETAIAEVRPGIGSL